MLREYNYILRKANIAADCVLSAVAFLVAHTLRVFLAIFIIPQYISPAPITAYGWPMIFLPVLTVTVLAYNGFYKSQRLRSRIRDVIKLVAVSCLEITALLVIAIYVFWRGNIVSRPLIFLIPFVLFFLLSLKTIFMFRVLRSIRARGFNFRRVVLVGSGEPLRRFIQHLEAHPIWGLKIEAIITDRPSELIGDGTNPPEAFGYPIIADVATAPEVLDRVMVEELVLVPNEAPLESLVPLMAVCEEMGVRTHLPLHYFEAQIARPVIDYFDDIPVISYWPTREIGPALLFKYAFDRAFAAASLALLSWLFLLTTIVIKLTSKRGEPVFYKQDRCGLSGRAFTCLKFRTMYVGADAMREELKNEADGPVFKMKHDPRVTPFGRFLRKFSIDELPQLWNVMRGDMSLVGPRPPLPEEVRKYDRWQRRRLSMKPGMTCLWQVSGRHRLSFDTWMKLDLQYIDNWSLTLDFTILMRTVFAVITGQGAM